MADSRSIRVSALSQRVTYYTTIAGARAACAGMRYVAALEPHALQTLHTGLHGGAAPAPKPHSSVVI